MSQAGSLASLVAKLKTNMGGTEIKVCVRIEIYGLIV